MIFDLHFFVVYQNVKEKPLRANTNCRCVKYTLLKKINIFDPKLDPLLYKLNIHRKK